MKGSLTAIAFLLTSSLWGYSIFNTRGFGGYTSAPEFLKVLPRSETSIETGFILEYNYATDGQGGQNAFLVRPEHIRFFVPIPGHFGLSLGVGEHYNLDFKVSSDSVSSADYTLLRTVTGRGGMEGFRVGLDKSIFDIVYLNAGYERLFGGGWERWDSEILKFHDTNPDSVVFRETTVDSLLYHFSGDIVWGMLGAHVGPVTARTFYSYPLGLRVRTEVQTERDTTVVDSAAYTLPAEFGGLVNLSFSDFSFDLAYIQQTPAPGTPFAFKTGRLVELSGQWRLEPLTLTGRLGWNSSYALTADSASISDIYLGVGTRIPIKNYGFGIVSLSGGLRNGGGITEYHTELRLGLEFSELWKKRERMWGG